MNVDSPDARRHESAEVTLSVIPDHRFAPLIDWLQVKDKPVVTDGQGNPHPDPAFMAAMPRSVSASAFYVRADEDSPKQIEGAWSGLLRFGPAGGRWPWLMFGTLAPLPDSTFGNSFAPSKNITPLGFSLHISIDAGTGSDQRRTAIPKLGPGLASVSFLGISNPNVPQPEPWEFTLNSVPVETVDEGGWVLTQTDPNYDQELGSPVTAPVVLGSMDLPDTGFWSGALQFVLGPNRGSTIPTV
jgi:hypothetical protein